MTPVKKETEGKMATVDPRTNVAASKPVETPKKPEVKTEEEKLFDSETKTEDGRVVLTSSVSEDEANKVKIGTEPIDLTQSLTGVPGIADLTQGGKLSGDRSFRTKSSIEEINEELEKVAGPNPTPNREGNEILKATQTVLAQGLVVNTAAIADQIKEMVEKNELNKEKLTEIEKQLRKNTRVA